MSKIYIVELELGDYETENIINLGIFTKRSLALDVKRKWETFYENSVNFEEPENWDPKKDKWYKEGDCETSLWYNSFEYRLLLEDHDYIDKFISINIIPIETNKDFFMNVMSEFSGSDKFIKMAKKHNRDFNLNKLLN